MMLRQIARRAARCQVITPSSTTSILTPARTYASASKPRKPPPPPKAFAPKSAGTKAAAAPPPAAAKVSPTGPISPSGIETQPSPAQGERPAEDAASAQSPLKSTQPTAEPIAQKENLDEPVSDIRSETQASQAAAENQAAPQKPLPDLRFGIPSTFAQEFGAGQTSNGENAGGESADKSGEAAGRRSIEEEDMNRSDFQTSIDRRRAAQARYGYALVLAFALLGGSYFARPFSDKEDVPAGLDPADATGWAPSAMYRRVQARMGDKLDYYTEPSFPKLLPDVPLTQRPPFTLVLSLEDLMVHSTWDRANGYRMAKRPGIDYFIRYLSPYYEMVLFTSVPIAIADPVIKKLDPYHFIMWPLGREATKYEKGEFVKDLSYLNRDLKKTLIIDTKAGHVKNQPENAIVLPKWSGDAKDEHTNDLVALIPFLEYIATMNIEDVREVIKSFEGKHIPTEFARREAIAREQFNKQLAIDKAKRPRNSLGSVFSGLGIKADRSSSMVLGDGQTVAEGLAQGKMLSDQIREQGQKQYMYLEKQIQEQGKQWLEDEEREQKRLMEEQMKEMKKNPVGTLATWFGGGAPPPPSKD